MEYIAHNMKVLTFYFSILVFLLMIPSRSDADSLATFEPEKSLIRYRFLKEQKPHDRESLYDELMSLKNWVTGELKQLKVEIGRAHV